MLYHTSYILPQEAPFTYTTIEEIQNRNLQADNFKGARGNQPQSVEKALIQIITFQENEEHSKQTKL